MLIINGEIKDNSIKQILKHLCEESIKVKNQKDIANNLIPNIDILPGEKIQEFLENKKEALVNLLSDDKEKIREATDKVKIAMYEDNNKIIVEFNNIGGLSGRGGGLTYTIDNSGEIEKDESGQAIISDIFYTRS